MTLGLIPQVFYDLIARVIPGAVTIFTWHMAILGPDKALKRITALASKENLFNFWSFALMVGASYVLGFILSEVWSLSFGKIKGTGTGKRQREIYRSCIAEVNNIRKQHGEPELALSEEEIPSIHVLHDHLRLYSDTEAYRLLKVQAEIRLCEGLFIGGLLIPIINIMMGLNASRAFGLDRLALEVVMVLALITFWRGANKFEKYYIIGVFRAWLFRNFPMGPVKQANKKDD